MHSIAVLGAGAWGSTLANVAARPGRTVIVWARESAVAEAITPGKVWPRLPSIPVPPGVSATSDLPQAVASAEAVLVAVPAQASRAVLAALGPSLREAIPVVTCAKGIEQGTRAFMTEVVAQALPRARPAILSGPSFAADVARGLPTAVALAAADEELAADLSRELSARAFRIYHSRDVRGVEIGGAAKNVLAIACGIVAGRQLGDSASAALTTRGFAELVRFGRAYGANPETLTGLSGLGDLVLTCSSAQSRNFALGVTIGEGRVPVSDYSGPLAEGAATAPVLVALAQERGVDMPIATTVAAVLAGRLDVDAAIAALLARPLRREIG